MRKQRLPDRKYLAESLTASAGFQLRQLALSHYAAPSPSTSDALAAPWSPRGQAPQFGQLTVGVQSLSPNSHEDSRGN